MSFLTSFFNGFSRLQKFLLTLGVLAFADEMVSKLRSGTIKSGDKEITFDTTNGRETSAVKSKEDEANDNTNLATTTTVPPKT